MAKKSPAPKSDIRPGGESTPAERVAWLLEAVWNGNRSEMARAVGVTHTVLSKIATGKQNPGRRLLEAIATHPKVNPEWLLSGQGDPLLADRPDEPAQGWPVKIATQLLPGPVDQYRHLLSNDALPVAGAFYRPSRYWYRVHMHDPITNAIHCKVAARDLLLMETDPKFWQDHPERLDRHFCAVALPGAGEPRLGMLQWDEETSGLEVNCFDETVAAEDRVSEFRIQIHPDGRYETRHLEFRVDRTKTGKPLQHVRNMRIARQIKPVSLKDIVGVAAMLVRTPPF